MLRLKQRSKLLLRAGAVLAALALMQPGSLVLAQSQAAVPGIADAAAAPVLELPWQESVSENGFYAARGDGKARFSLELIPAMAQFATTRDTASALMGRLQGFGLQPQLAERGYSFSYTDALPCQALLSYFDGSQYLFCRICGELNTADFARLYDKAALQLRLQARLRTDK